MSESDPYARLRAALKHEYRIEEVLREADDGAAYLARDLTLERQVLVRALDPARAGEARGAEFAREARVLASLSHPSIPAIHHAGTTGDFRFIVVEHLEGPTLERRMRDGRLSPDEVLRLGVQILGALETAHAAGIMHTDVVSRNVIAGEGRYVLDGFGRAATASREMELADLTAVGRLLGEAAGGTLPGPLRAAVERALDRSAGNPSAGGFR